MNNLRWSAPEPIGQFNVNGNRGQRGEWGAMCHSDLEGVPDIDDETYLDLVNKGYFSEDCLTLDIYRSGFAMILNTSHINMTYNI